MTKDEKLKILSDAEVRAYKMVEVTSGEKMCTQEFRNLLLAIDHLGWAQEGIANPEQIEVPAPTPDAPKEDPKPAPAETPAPVKEDEPAADPGKPALSKQQMISKLTQFQTSGVAIDKVMGSMGYAKLSHVPENRYDELLNLCQEALDGEG